MVDIRDYAVIIELVYMPNDELSELSDLGRIIPIIGSQTSMLPNTMVGRNRTDSLHDSLVALLGIGLRQFFDNSIFTTEPLHSKVVCRSPKKPLVFNGTKFDYENDRPIPNFSLTIPNDKPVIIDVKHSKRGFRKAGFVRSLISSEKSLGTPCSKFLYNPYQGDSQVYFVDS